MVNLHLTATNPALSLFFKGGNGRAFLQSEGLVCASLTPANIYSLKDKLSLRFSGERAQRMTRIFSYQEL